ncbi:MAG: DUF4907 domain-containing protein [Bacteroidota bacterium]|nr:DUF4907 domain-containing protein [Bacteroidota bacterium]
MGDENESLAGKDSVNNDTSTSRAPRTVLTIEVKTILVKDSADKPKGWGYDLYVDGKRTIHQPIIPAVPGNDAFATEQDARRTGEVAMKKMKMTGSFPTITIQELDSLGIKHQ